MRNLRVIFEVLKVIVISIVVMVNVTLGHGWVRDRSSCFWGGWNKLAGARVTKYFLVKQDVEKDCNPTYPLRAQKDISWHRGICAYQLSELIPVSGGYYVPHMYGYVNARRCGRGTCYSDLYKEIVDEKGFDLGEEYEISELKGTPIIISHDRVKIEAITGRFIVKGTDVFSKAEIIIWFPQNEQDTVPTNEKMLYYALIEFSRGELIVAGNGKDDIKYEVENKPNGEVVVTYKLSIDIPLSREGAEVFIKTDGGFLEESSIEPLVDTKLKGIDINVFPNPISKNVNLNIALNNLSNTEIKGKLKVFDGNGSFLKLSKEFSINPNSVENFSIKIPSDAFTSPQRFIYLLIETSNGRTIWKVLLK